MTVIDPNSLTDEKDRAYLAHTTLVQDVKAAEKAVEVLESLPSDTIFACDTETIDIDPKVQSPVGNGRVVCFSVYAGEQVDFGTGPRLWVDTLNDPAILPMFKPFFENASALKVWHNIGFDRHVLYNHGIDVQGFFADTMHMARLYDAARRTYSLASLSTDLLRKESKTGMKELFGVAVPRKDGTPGLTKTVSPADVLQNDPVFFAKWVHYSAFDAKVTYDLFKKLHGFLSKEMCKPCEANIKKSQGISLFSFYKTFWRPFGHTLTEMERRGVKIDVPYLQQQEAAALRDLDRFANEFIEWAVKYCPDAKYMNLNSDLQKRQLLFAPCKHKWKEEEAMEATKSFTAQEKFWSELMPEGSGLVSPEDEVVPDEEEEAEAEAEEDTGEGDAKKKKKKKKKVEKKKPKRVVKVKPRDIVLDGMGLPPMDYTTAGWASTKGAVIRLLAGEPRANPPRFGSAMDHFKSEEEGKAACFALDSLCQMEAVETLVTVFIRPLQELVDKKSRVHCSLNLNTETGRLSARKPNLQNQPALDKDVYKVRKAFSCDPNNLLISADYGQLELRLLAHMTKCKSMIAAFKQGGDFHSRTAIGMYPHIKEAVSRGEVLLEWDPAKGPLPKPLLKDKYAAERKKAKTLNFSIAYGKTAQGLATDWGVSREEAQEVLTLWFKDRPEVQKWQQQTIIDARRTQKTYTLMGRSRNLPDIKDSSWKKRSHAERAAINTPIQGGAADVVVAAMVSVEQDEELRKLGWHMLLQIHDEILVEGPANTADKALERVKTLMKRPLYFVDQLRVDLDVDARIGTSWYECK